MEIALKTPNRCISATNSLVAASTLAILAAAAAQAQPVSHWDLPGQPLADSLREVASRSESNILFDGKLVSGQSARPLKTKASADEALTHLLAGTGLTYRHLDEKTVTIQLASAAQDSKPASSISQRRNDDLPQVAVMIEEIVVTGTQIRGIENNTAPLIVLSKQYIDSTGFGTTTKLIESLPQNFALANQSSIVTPGVSSSSEQGSAINLRGIGEGTTLVLLNGRRLAPGFQSAAVDISALPLTAIQQVEILTDGASALYGSDAVSGVVNFILRDDFEGAETRLRSGFADGTNEYRVSQALGSAWESGNALLSLEYYQRDQLLAKDRDFVPTSSMIGTLLPEDENYSAVFTGSQQLSGSVTLFADVLYAQRDSSNQGRQLLNEKASIDNPQAFGTLGVDWQVGGDWQIELSGSYGRNDLDVDATRLAFLGGPTTAVSVDTLFESQAAQIKADGTVLALPGGNMRMAIGADWRSDSYESALATDGFVSRTDDKDQIVRSGFVELYVPLVGESNSMTAIKSFELSLAGRYDDYSSFGSSFDPQYGLMWQPVSGLRLRARHGTSYKAPNLVEYNLSGNLAAAIPDADPGAPLGSSYQLQLVGANVGGFTAQESESSSFGLEFSPESVSGLNMALNYYRIKYRNRIATPPLPQVLLADQGSFGSLFIRTPSADQVNQFIALGQLGQGFLPFNPIDFSFPDPNFTPASVEVIVDLRRRNLSVVDTDGLDLSGRYDFAAGEGRIALGLDATYVLELQQQITSTSTAADTVATYNNPPDWRARAYMSWQVGGWTTNLFVNHTDSYVDNRTATPTPIDSYTTVDARLAYSFTQRFPTGFLSGVTVGASVLNLADEDPPRTAVVTPIGGSPGTGFDPGFDTTNASPLGRFIALELTKQW